MTSERISPRPSTNDQGPQNSSSSMTDSTGMKPCRLEPVPVCHRGRVSAAHQFGMETIGRRSSS